MGKTMINVKKNAKKEGILQNLLKVVYTFITKKYQQCSVDLIFTLYKTQKVLTDK